MSWGRWLGLWCLGSLGHRLCTCWGLSWGLLCPGASCHLWACPWPGSPDCAVDHPWACAFTQHVGIWWTLACLWLSCNVSLLHYIRDLTLIHTHMHNKVVLSWFTWCNCVATNAVDAVLFLWILFIIIAPFSCDFNLFLFFMLLNLFLPLLPCVLFCCHCLPHSYYWICKPNLLPSSPFSLFSLWDRVLSSAPQCRSRWLCQAWDRRTFV